MNAQTKTEIGGWPEPKKTPQIDDTDLMDRWKSATQRVSHYAAENGWTKSEVARRADIAIGTFSGWYDGTYNGRYDTTTLRVENFLTSYAEASKAASSLPADPGFVQTSVARRLFETFAYAQALSTMSIVTIVSGLGKTMAARAFTRSRPHVIHVTLSPSSRTPNTMMVAIGRQLGIKTSNAVDLEGLITKALSRDGFSALLIVDEAQNLNEACINQLRTFGDLADCGIVLLGNDETTTPYASRDQRHASPQVISRVGDRLSIMRSDRDDVGLILDAWDIHEKDIREVAISIASRPGAYRALTQTLKAACMIARGMDRGLMAEDLRAAYQRRGGGPV